MQLPFDLSFHWVLAPFVVQGLLMAVDEFHYHRARGLPDWERLGHPLDTLTVLAPLLFVRFAPPTSAPSVALFALLALFSCVFIAKDEGVHLRHSTAGEQRLHAFLFMLHPPLFLAMAALWLPLHGLSDEAPRDSAEFCWGIGVLLVSGFLGWQVIRWRAHEVILGRTVGSRDRRLKRAR